MRCKSRHLPGENRHGGYGWIVCPGNWRYRRRMTNLSLNIPMLLLAALLVLAACAEKKPYIYNADEFNRESPNFAKEVKNRSFVEICYNRKTTTPAKVKEMAEIECAKFGKRAHFNKHNTLLCSVTAPAQAEFYCLAPGETASSRSAGK
mgnify:CR=1 FL=1